MNLGFHYPLALLLGLLAIIPARFIGQSGIGYPSVDRLPEDPLSGAIDRSLRLTGVLAVLGLAWGIAGPHLKEQWLERVGTGAHIVLLVDHSSSMNENFSGRYLGGRAQESKSAIASKLLAEFVRHRGNDLFALVAFSAAPIYVLPLTQDGEAVEAAIRSLSSRGHGITNIAPGLAMALEHFRGQALTGARVILLVSDGAARMDEETRDFVRQGFQDSQSSLYWIYLRNPNSGSLSVVPKNPNETTTPEYFLHQYFLSLGVPYHVYEAENSEAVQRAIADVGRLENQPLHYREKLPRQDLSAYGYGAALVCLLVLLAFRSLELKAWRS